MAKKRWEDLVDFSGIEKTEKQVQDLEKEFVSLFTTIRSFAQTTNQEVAKNEQVFKAINEEIKKLNTTTPKQRDRISEIAKEVMNLDKSQEDLKKTQEGQIKTVNTLNKSYKSLKEELKAEKAALEKSNIATKEGREEAQKAAKNIERLSKETQDLQRATRGANSTLTAAKGSYNALQLETEQLRKRLRSLEGGIGSTSKEFKDLQKKIASNTDKLKEFDKGINQNFRNVGNYPKLLDELKGSFSGVFGPGGAIGIAVAAITALGAGFVALIKETKDFNKLAQRTNAITGQTGKNLQNITASIKATAETFDQDYNEVLRAANAVSNEFGEDLDTVIEKINVAFVSGADLSGDLLDNLREYATQAKSANLTLEEFINLNIESARKGFFNDKLIDAVKEVNLRLGDLTKGQREALQTLGAVGTEVERLFLSGKQSEAIRLLSSEIIKLEKAGKNAQPVIANLFGAPGEDLGIKGLEVLATFQDINVELTDYQKLVLEGAEATEEYNRSIGQLGEGFETLSLEVDILVTKIKTELANAILDLFGKSSPEIRRATEDARKWAETIKDEDIPKRLEQAGKKVEELSKKVEEARKKAELKGGLNFLVRREGKKDLKVLEPQLLKLTTLVEILEGRQAAIVKKAEEEKRKERKKTAKETIKVVEERIIKTEFSAKTEVENFTDAEIKKTQIQKVESKKRIDISKQEEMLKKTLLDESLNLTFNALTTFADQRATNEQIRRDNELAAIDQNLQAELQLAGDNEERKAQLSKRAEQERKKILREQAQAEKKRAILNIGLSIAEGIARALASSAPPANFIFAALVAAQGAVQLAAANSQPIPQFEEGTKGKEHKGLAIVNEQFKSKGSEVFRQGNKFFTMNTDGPALVNFDKPTEVIGYKDLEYTEKGNPLGLISKKTALNVTNNGFNDSRMISRLDKVDSSIKDIKLNINVKGKGSNSYKMAKMNKLNIISK